MALPKLNDMPKYSVTIPSSKQEVRIRPFVVKEEKILLIAMESQDPKQIANAILETVVSCTETKQDHRMWHNLTSYDVEYLFLQIRAKSVGEKTNVGIACQKCNEVNEVEVNLNEIKVNGEIPESKIKLNDNITIEMKAPSYLEIADNEKIISTQTTDIEKIFGIITSSISAVLTEEERIEFKDVNEEEKTEFIDSMSNEQFDKIRGWIESQPSIRHTVKFECSSCGHNNESRLEGMQSFF